MPVNGAVVLSFTRMNRILEIDAANLITVVEPGVVTFLLQQEVAKQGLFYPPDPASYKYSSIGGNVAECAGGPNSLKYGVTRDYVLGLEVVLPTGEILNLGVKTMKGVVGYDLTRLFVGSEGTLGVITKITLKLIPLPEAKATILALFGEVEEAAETVSAIIAAKVVPSTIEFMDKASIRCSEQASPMGLPDGVGGLLLIEVDGSQGIGPRAGGKGPRDRGRPPRDQVRSDRRPRGGRQAVAGPEGALTGALYGGAPENSRRRRRPALRDTDTDPLHWKPCARGSASLFSVSAMRVTAISM